MVRVRFVLTGFMCIIISILFTSQVALSKSIGSLTVTQLKGLYSSKKIEPLSTMGEIEDVSKVNFLLLDTKTDTFRVVKCNEFLNDNYILVGYILGDTLYTEYNESISNIVKLYPYKDLSVYLGNRQLYMEKVWGRTLVFSLIMFSLCGISIVVGYIVGKVRIPNHPRPLLLVYSGLIAIVINYSIYALFFNPFRVSKDDFNDANRTKQLLKIVNSSLEVDGLDKQIFVQYHCNGGVGGLEATVSDLVKNIKD